MPLLVADNKLGEWNTFWIKMEGNKVSVKLNGKLVVDNCVFLEGKVPTEEATRRVGNSPWAGVVSEFVYQGNG